MLKQHTPDIELLPGVETADFINKALGSALDEMEQGRGGAVICLPVPEWHASIVVFSPELSRQPVSAQLDHARAALEGLTDHVRHLEAQLAREQVDGQSDPMAAAVARPAVRCVPCRS